MNISDIIAAFGQDERLEYSELAPRLGLKIGNGPAASFSRKLGKFNLRTKRTRIGDKTVRAYHLSHFQQVQETKKPYWEFEITL